MLESIKLPLNHRLYLTILSLRLYLYACISPSYTKFSPSSINCNSVVKNILQTRPRWTHEREGMPTILPDWPLTQLPHPDTIDHRKYMCALLSDIPHTQMHISSRSITHPVWPLATQASIIKFCRFSMLHQFYAMRSPQILEHSRIITSYRGVIFRGTRFHSGSQCSNGPAPKISQWHEFSFGASHSGASRCILWALAFANLEFLHPYRVLLIGVADIRHWESIHSGAPDKESIHSGAPDKILNRNTGLPSSIYIWTIEVISPGTFNTHLKLNPPQLCATSCSIYPVFVLHFILYALLIHSLPHSLTVYLHYSQWNLRPARWGITIHRRIKMHTWRDHLHSRKQPIFISHQVFAFQWSAFVHHIADD